MSAASEYFCDYAWLGGDSAQSDVLVAIEGDRFTKVQVGSAKPKGATHLRGLTLPGLANSHSHAFHRALRGQPRQNGGDFWLWRGQMYHLAEALSPTTYFDLARAVYAEMALSGITSVGEFHYLHHQAGGKPYEEPNEIGLSLIAAARSAGLRVTLLDALYLQSAPGRPPEGVQARFSDGSAENWAERVGSLQALNLGPGARVGAAVHSLRSVPPRTAAEVASHPAAATALHLHLSEQELENEQVKTAYGRSPTATLDGWGILAKRPTAVHATHLSETDIASLGAHGCGICMCPTTEQDLGDGIGPARRLNLAGASICLGTDSHAIVDLFQEMRCLEYDERLASGTRGHWTAAELLEAATSVGHRALGWPEAGAIRAGFLADLVTLDLASVRLAGVAPENSLSLAAFSACAADVSTVVCSGRLVVADGRHLAFENLPALMSASVQALFT